VRFTPTKDNLVVQLAPNEAASLVRKAVALLVPRYTKKVYFLAESQSLFAQAQDGLAVVKPGSEPSNFLHSFRLLLREGELVLVSSQQHRFTQSEWRGFAEALASAT
jgi:hypothetical protein